jgi:hypothetical protein
MNENELKAKKERIAKAQEAQKAKAEFFARLDRDEYLHTRQREHVDSKGRKRYTLQVHLAPNPERLKSHPCYRVPAGPGRRPVPNAGRWMDMSDYLRKRIRSGCLVECAPADGLKQAAAALKENTVRESYLANRESVLEDRAKAKRDKAAAAKAAMEAKAGKAKG